MRKAEILLRVDRNKRLIRVWKLTLFYKLNFTEVYINLEKYVIH
jgi:hypothetical protein